MKLTPPSLALTIAFAITFFATGASLWPLEYSEVSLPNSLYGIGLIVLVASAAAVRALTLVGLWKTMAVLGLAPAAAVFARVIVETTLDPTSHNLWPLELVIAVGVGFPLALLSALLGGLVGPWLRDQIAKRG